MVETGTRRSAGHYRLHVFVAYAAAFAVGLTVAYFFCICSWVARWGRSKGCQIVCVGGAVVAG